MNFCATCGRQRTGNSRFCAGCGTELPAAATAASGTPLADEPAEATRLETAASEWTASADATRVERQPDVTRLDARGASAAPGAPAEPDPFASWFAADAPEGQAAARNDPPGGWQQPTGPQQPAGSWQQADTVYSAPGQHAPAYPPPQPPPPYGGQQGRPQGGQPPSGGRKAVFTVGVVLVMLAAGGGAYALVSRSHHHNTAQSPTSTPTVAASSSATASAPSSASASPSTSTSASPSTSASASASASPGVVALGPGVASNPAEPAVETTLTNYFQGINTRNYGEYASSLDPQQRAGQPESAFKSGYSSTSDSGMTLVSLTPTDDGGLQAEVTFTSHQAQGTGVDGSACNNWTLDFFLVKQGNGYLKGAAPSGYQPTHSDC